jgi:hypothetical protein
MSYSYGYLCLRIVFVYARLADLLNIITSIDFLRFFSVCFNQAHEERGSTQSLHLLLRDVATANILPSLPVYKKDWEKNSCRLHRAIIVEPEPRRGTQNRTQSRISINLEWYNFKVDIKRMDLKRESKNIF